MGTGPNCTFHVQFGPVPILHLPFLHLYCGDDDAGNDYAGAEEFVGNVLLLEDEAASEDGDNYADLLKESHNGNFGFCISVGNKEAPVSHEEEYGNKPYISVLPDALCNPGLGDNNVYTVIDEHVEHVPELELPAGDISCAHKILIKISRYCV